MASTAGSNSSGKARVLVISGSGYVGQFVIAALLRHSGVEIHTTHRPSRDMSCMPSKVSCHTVDYTDAEAISKLLGELQPGVVVNCGAMSALGACEKDPENALRANAPKALVESLPPSSFFIHLSTDIVFEGDPTTTYNEEAPVKPLNVYGQSKAAFDTWLLQLQRGSDASKGPLATILRCSNIVGPRHPFCSTGTKFLQWLDTQLQQDGPVNAFADEVRNYVWVEDLVEVIEELTSLPAEDRATAPRLLHCGGPDALTRVDMAELVLAARGLTRTYTGADGQELPRIVPTPRSTVSLGYEAPLCIRFESKKVEYFLGRPFRSMKKCIPENLERL